MLIEEVIEQSSSPSDCGRVARSMLIT